MPNSPRDIGHPSSSVEHSWEMSLPEYLNALKVEHLRAASHDQGATTLCRGKDKVRLRVDLATHR